MLKPNLLSRRNTLTEINSNTRMHTSDIISARTYWVLITSALKYIIRCLVFIQYNNYTVNF